MRTKFIIIIMSLLLPSILVGQSKEDHTGLTLGFSFGIGQPYKAPKDFQHLNKCHHVGMLFSPRVGISFLKKLEAGAFARYEDMLNRTSWWGFGGYVEYRFLYCDSDRFRMFVDFQASHNRDTRWWLGGPPKYNFAEVGVIPGIAYRIPHSRFDIKLRYMFIGFNNAQAFYKDFHGCLGKHGNWLLDASLRRLELGVAVTLF